MRADEFREGVVREAVELAFQGYKDEVFFVALAVAFDSTPTG